ncbi:MAG: hypothetical protein GY708_23040, partial [Actinomycetia bacterium]|nr:hypothetical protein [Actinomycetes bacterium]
LHGNGGNDTLYNASSVDVGLFGHAGDDTITGGSADDTQLVGGANDDTIRGRGGRDTVTGGSGNDSLIEHVADLELSEFAIGGEGADRIVIVGSSAADDLRVTIDGSNQVKISSYRSDGTEAGSITLRDQDIDAIGLLGVGGRDSFSLTGALDLGGVTNDVVIDVGSDSAPDEVNVTLSPRTDVGDTLDIDAISGGVQGVWQDHFTFVVTSGDASDGDTLFVHALGGVDQLTVGAGTDGLRVQDSLDVVLDGGADNDTLSTVYSKVDLIGGDGADVAVIRSDPNSTNDKPDITVVSDRVAVYRNSSLMHLVNYSEVEDLTLELGDATTGNDLTVQSTPGYPLRITGSTGNDNVVIESVHASGNVDVDLIAGTNTVTLGKSGSLALLDGPVVIADGSGTDTVIFDNSNDPTGRSVTPGSTSVSGLPLPPTAVTFGATVETVRLELGLSDDVVTIEGTGFARRIEVHGGGGSDVVDAYLDGDSAGGGDGRQIFTQLVETVNFTDRPTSNPKFWQTYDDTHDTQLLASSTDGSSFGHVVLEVEDTPATNISFSNDVDNLLVTSLTTPMSIDFGGGADEVTVGDSSTLLGIDTVAANLSLVAQAGATIEIDDSGRPWSDTHNPPDTIDSPIVGTFAAGSVSQFGMSGSVSIDYSGFGSLSFISSLNASYDIAVTGTSTATTIDLDDNVWEDVVTVTGAAEALTVNGQDEDQLILDNSALAVPVQASIGDGVNAGTARFTDQSTGLPNPIQDVSFSGFSGAGRGDDSVNATVVKLSANNDSLQINKTNTGTAHHQPLWVNGNGGDDTVRIIQIGGPTYVSGDGENDIVMVDVPGLPSGTDHSTLAEHLSFDVETLVIDNSVNSAPVDWLVESGEVGYYDGTPQTANDFLTTDGAGGVRILGGISDS